WFTDTALALLPTALPITAQIQLNGRVLVFALAVSISTGLLFGILPARFGAQVDIDTTLRGRARGVTDHAGSQQLLVVAQIALTPVLLVGTGLLMRSLANLLTGSFGFAPRGLLIVHTELPITRRATPDTVRAAFSDLNERLGALPGVDAASVMVGSP